jgi:hypothetical protein
MGPSIIQQEEKDQSTHKGGGPRLGSNNISKALKAFIVKLYKGGRNYLTCNLIIVILLITIQNYY